MDKYLLYEYYAKMTHISVYCTIP